MRVEPLPDDEIRDAVAIDIGERRGWAAPDAADPTKPWVVHPVSEQGYTVLAQHGIGAGDINGDGRMDIVSPYGWWEQPPKGTPAGPWPYHPALLGRWPRAGASPGGAEMGVYDVNGDGLRTPATGPRRLCKARQEPAPTQLPDFVPGAAYEPVWSIYSRGDLSL